MPSSHCLHIYGLLYIQPILYIYKVLYARAGSWNTGCRETRYFARTLVVFPKKILMPRERVRYIGILHVYRRTHIYGLCWSRGCNLIITRHTLSRPRVRYDCCTRVCVLLLYRMDRRWAEIDIATSLRAAMENPCPCDIDFLTPYNLYYLSLRRMQV